MRIARVLVLNKSARYARRRPAHALNKNNSIKTQGLKRRAERAFAAEPLGEPPFLSLVGVIIKPYAF